MSDPRVPFARDPEPDPDTTTATTVPDPVADTVPRGVPVVPEAAPPDPDRASGDTSESGYSATVLGSHWFDTPHPGTVRATAPPGPDPTPGIATTLRESAPTPVMPDRVEGSVLRFGPGVTAAAAARPAGPGTLARWHGAPPRPPVPVRRRRRGAGLRRYALALLVLLAVLGYLSWQRFGPVLRVTAVEVRTDPAGPACDTAARVVAVVRTDGRPGTLRYRWARSDGGRSAELTERVPQGRRETRLNLLWTFRGEGTYRARATLELLGPAPRTASAGFTYRCP
ncbi:hypothetical protein [Streptomyces sp. NPDC097619]|uniref:hypothetical protein n=1 Tax=Streptomyces sp. NPDC097619 TaxID=3157228 RepID=UPI00331AD51A